MTASPFLSPVTSSATQQHPVADVRYAAELYAALPAQPEGLGGLKDKHITSVKAFSKAEVLELFRLAAGYECGALKPAQLPPGSIMCDLFLDYTRPQIRLSFNHA